LQNTEVKCKTCGRTLFFIKDGVLEIKCRDGTIKRISLLELSSLRNELTVIKI